MDDTFFFQTNSIEFLKMKSDETIEKRNNIKKILRNFSKTAIFQTFDRYRNSHQLKYANTLRIRKSNFMLPSRTIPNKKKHCQLAIDNFSLKLKHI